MKKLLRVGILLLFLIVLTTGIACAETRSQTVKLTTGQNIAQVNGKNITMAAPAQVVAGRTLVPLRFIGEAFGCQVAWDGTNKTAKVILGNHTIQVPIAQNYATIDGLQVSIEVPAQLINGNTYVPLRFIAESLGSEVSYDVATKETSIVMNTYYNKELDFKVAVPVGYTVVEGDDKDITIINKTQGVICYLALGYEEPEVTEANFKSFADGFFSNFVMKKDFQYSTVSSRIISAKYKEEGGIINCTVRWLDNGWIYASMFGAPVDPFSEQINIQANIVSNTLRPYTAQ